MIQGGCRTSQDIPPYIIAGKEPIRFAGLNLIGLRRRGFSNETILALREAYNAIYSKGVIKEGLEAVRNTMEITPEIQYVLDFIEKAERGIIR
jgi:UDP-N-acetylglucosamine acyltransferase